MGLLGCVCDVYGVALCFVAVVAVAFLVGLLIGIGILGLRLMIQRLGSVALLL